MDEPQAREVFEFGEFLVDAGQRLLRSRADGEPIPLTPKVFETLLFLVEHCGELVDKATLMTAVWPNVVVEENNLNQAISTLRKALGESAVEHRFIVTVPGRGYRFVAPVKRVSRPTTWQVETLATPSPDPSPSSANDAAPSEAASGILALTTGKPSRIVLPVALALVVAIALWVSMRTPESPRAVSGLSSDTATITAIGSETPTAGKLRLAVLPFENLSPDPANAFFADGLHEEIISTLARRAPGIEIISRTTMMGYRARPKPVQQVAGELAASHVLEGSVRREQNKVRMTVQLIDARIDRHLWTQNYDRTLSDALTLQSDVAGEVASQLSIQLSGGTQPAAPLTQNPEAYDLYLKALLARVFLTQFAPIERYRHVEDLLSRAIDLDPKFAAAYAQRATFRGAMVAFNYDVSAEQVRRIREDVDAGLRLAPADPLVLAAEALYWSWVERDLARGLKSFEAAERAGLTDPMFLFGKSALTFRARRIDETLRFNERLMALDPGNPFLLTNSAAMLYGMHRPVEALRMIDRGLEQFPDDVGMPLLRGQVIFGHTGRTDEWRARLDRASAITSPLALLDQHFNLLRMEKRYAELQKLLDGVTETTVRVISGSLGGGFYGVGERPTALYRGWTALLRGDPVQAAKHGRSVLRFVERQQETDANKWFLRLLTAQGNAFLGQKERAHEAAREALELMPPSRDALSWLSAAGGSAAAYAWSDAQNEAAALLEEVAAAIPSPGPAWVARDPLFTVPLAQNSRYRVLVERVEAEMRAARL